MKDIKIYKIGEKLFTAKNENTSWTFLEELDIKKYKNTSRRIFAVKCKCGRIKNVQYNNIRTGKSKCCGYSPCVIVYNKNNKSVDTSYNSLYYSYNKGAKDRGLEFELSMNEFKDFIHKDCFYCGQNPSQLYQILDSKTGLVRAGIPILYNGIDRVDNKRGYTIENSVTCCKKCNKMKLALEANDFIYQIKKIYEFLNLSCANVE